MFISKSKFLFGLKGNKLLWRAYNGKHLIPCPDGQQQSIVDQGLPLAVRLKCHQS